MSAPTTERVAYIVSKFPKLTETFVLYEALALRDLGVEIHIFPLVPYEEKVAHPEIESLQKNVHLVPLASGAVLGAVLRLAALSPIRFARSVVSLFRGSGGSLGHFARGLAIFPRACWIAQQLKTDRFDHVHAHFANHPALAARLVHDLTSIPYSFTAHGSDLHRDPRGLRTKVEASSFTVAISEYNKRFILERTGEDLAPKIDVLFCGADLGRFQDEKASAAADPAAPDAGTPDPRNESQPARPFRIACVAALREVKGHTHLLAAIETARSRGVDVECELAGEGPLRARLEAEIQTRGLEHSVRLLGACQREEIRALLQRSDAIALTSILDSSGRREGIPVSLMEGMAAGLPVISSRLSGIPELVTHGESGLLVDPGDEEGLAQAIETLRADPELRQRMGRAGRLRVEQDFDLAENAAALADKIRGAILAAR
ncbi:GDP-mannose-dependent alpha-(1-6)-phosphatidylinositol monomannoside mannosyltransferase [Planctomycetes bacterium Poly30]|uniref:GDP-mannose-dependent alpha-(1-6)-phosphatidylinositol monomannoside mannosyltransferase n=1 Tax=Saltatorellus ferox TaxID=2528018 RepID=A0A518EM75_9BACT|nr:GDP-mannose-dependent alpha-(1-6)-phosphatidylinositol monomannoside mannosyltransferase [Planctomycetes bacterium Poly30]